MKSYDVIWKRRVQKAIDALPKDIQKLFYELVLDMEASGPVRKDWPNYSKLGKTTHHCHLAYSWVAVWEHEKHAVVIEVTYVGSREGAPY